MFSRGLSFKRGLHVAATVWVLTGCGVLGDKGEFDKFLDVASGNSGCLNDIKPAIDDFFNGNIKPSRWEAKFECVRDTHDLFMRFVSGSAGGGYTPEDIHILVNKVLVTNKEVPVDLIRGTFELKASVFGGRSDVISRADLKQVLKILDTVKVESVALIPHFLNRRVEPTPETMLPFANAIQAFGQALSKSFVINGTVAFERATAERIVRHLRDVFEFEFDEELIGPAFVGKGILLAGSTSSVESSIWHRLVEKGFNALGPVIALTAFKQEDLEDPTSYGEFFLGMVEELKDVLVDSVNIHNGRIRLHLLDELVDEIPDDWLEINGGKATRPTVKDTLRPLFSKTLQARVFEAIDLNVVNNIFTQFSKWSIGQTHIDKIFKLYELNPTGVSADEFIRSALKYSESFSLAEKQPIFRLINIASEYTPMFLDNDSFASYPPPAMLSRGNMRQMHLFNLIPAYLLPIYSTHPKRHKASLQDFRDLIYTYQPLMEEIFFLDPTIPDETEKRFNEADLFTYASNGDRYMDMRETTYYLAMITTTVQMGARIRDAYGEECNIEFNGSKTDPIGWPWMSIQCWRDRYFENFRTHWDHMSDLTRWFKGLSEDHQQTVATKMEAGGMRFGVQEHCPVGNYGSKSFSGTVQFLDAVFYRFDTNSDGVIDEDEAVAATPVFTKLIAKVAEREESETDFIEAVFTYLLKFGVKPEDDLWGTIDFLWWMIKRPFWKIRATRENLYQIISFFSNKAGNPGPLCDGNGEPPAGG